MSIPRQEPLAQAGERVRRRDAVAGDQPRRDVGAGAALLSVSLLVLPRVAHGELAADPGYGQG